MAAVACGQPHLGSVGVCGSQDLAYIVHIVSQDLFAILCMCGERKGGVRGTLTLVLSELGRHWPEFSFVPVQLKMLIKHPRVDIKRPLDMDSCGEGAGGDNVGFVVVETVLTAMG